MANARKLSTFFIAMPVAVTNGNDIHFNHVDSAGELDRVMRLGEK